MTPILNDPQFTAVLTAAKNMVNVATPTCLTVTYSMLAVQIFWMITQVIVFGKGWQLDPVLRVVGLIFFISFYNEFAVSIIYSADYIANLFDAKKEILSSLEKISTGNLQKKHETTIAIIGTLPYDNFSSFVAWLMSKIQEGLSLAVRILLSRVQYMLLGFVYVTGIFASMMASIPNFRGSFGHWLKSLVTVLLWGLTLSILDTFVKTYLASYVPDTADETLDLVIFNVAIIFMYISVPVLTAMYIGHHATAGSGILSKVQGVAGGVGAAAGERGLNVIRNGADMIGGKIKGAYENYQNRNNSANRLNNGNK